MEPERFLQQIVKPAAEWLGGFMGRRMTEPQRLLLAVAIAIEETNLATRRQELKNGHVGPGRSWWQNEGGPQASIGLLMKHPVCSRPFKQACIEATIPWELETIHEAVAWNDFIAAVICLLLIYSDSEAVPDVSDEYGMWSYYWRTWRPGAYRIWKPGDPAGDRWHEAHRRAFNAVTRVYCKPEDYEETDMSKVTAESPQVTMTAAEYERLRASQAAAAVPLQPAVSVKEITAAAIEREAVDRRSLTVSPPSVGNQVIVDPVQFKNAFKHGSTYIALLLGVLQYLPEILPMFIPSLRGAFGPVGEAAAQQPPWASALVVFGRYMRDVAAANGAAKVAAAAVDPLGPQQQPIGELATVVGAGSVIDHTDVLAEIRDELRRQRQAKAA